MLDDERIKCWRASAITDVTGPVGQVISADGAGVTVACGEGALRLESVQRPGRRRVSGGEFAAQAELAGKQL